MTRSYGQRTASTATLDICGRHGITLNPDKFRFAMDTIEFAGFEITTHSVRPSVKYTKAISETSPHQGT